MRLIAILGVAAGWLILYWLARRYDRRKEREWLDERAAERDWTALERWRWHTSDGILLECPERLPGAIERQYMQALADGEHEETAYHGRW